MKQERRKIMTALIMSSLLSLGFCGAPAHAGCGHCLRVVCEPGGELVLTDLDAPAAQSPDSNVVDG